MKRLILLPILFLTSCTFTIKNDVSITGGRIQEASITVAPLVCITKEDGQKKVHFFAVAPIPEKTTTTTTTPKQTTITEKTETPVEK